jgi:S-adenosylmethionine:tRNA ribosyltransferase-isomerase
VEVLVLNRVLPQTYEVLLKPSGRIKNGEIIYLGNHDQPEEARILKSRQGTFINLNDRAFERFKTDSQAEVPLPPYIKRSPQNSDEDNYQTVYAVQEGSIAAPTAGFHFTRPLIAALEKHGIKILKIVLHIGYGTFRPIGTENIKAHRMHAEFVTLDRETAAGINAARRRKKRIIAVGTSATRALESAYSLELDAVIPFSGFSELFITPGYRFKVAQALITNFHLPKTTLFALVCAFAGTKTAHRLYQEAIDQKYRFYSYGDAMLLV